MFWAREQLVRCIREEIRWVRRLVLLLKSFVRIKTQTVDKEQDASCVRANLYYLRFTFSGLAMCLQSRHSITWV